MSLLFFANNQHNLIWSLYLVCMQIYTGGLSGNEQIKCWLVSTDRFSDSWQAIALLRAVNYVFINKQLSSSKCKSNSYCLCKLKTA